MKNEELIESLNLHDYQKACLDFVLHTARCGLFLPVGAGKTRIVLAALTALMPNHPILVVAPAPIARISWREEIQDTGLPIPYKSFVTGPKGGKTLPKKKRLAMYEQVDPSSLTLYTISRELLKDLIDWHMQNKKQWPFPILVIDELQSFKNHRSERFKALKTVIEKTYRFIGLTGTPAPQGVIDLWAPVYLMDKGFRLGRNITVFRNAFFNEGLHINGQCVDWVPKPVMPLLDQNLEPVTDASGKVIWTAEDSESVIYKRIQDIVISIDITKYLVMPKRIDAVHKIPLDDAEMKKYTELLKDKVLTLKETGESVTVTAENAASLSQKLTQMASGNLYIDAEHHYICIHKKKLEMLQYIVDNEPTPILVAYYFRTDLDTILEAIPDAVHFSGEPAIKEKWDAGQIHVMVIHPASVGHGLNLQKAGHTLVWYTMPWSLEHYIQTMGRIYRQGQVHTTVIHYLITKGTVDERILRALQKKDAKQTDLIEAVKLFVEDSEANEPDSKK